MPPTSNTTASSQNATGVSSTSNTAATSHQATPGMAHSAGAASHRYRLSLMASAAASHQFGHEAATAAATVAGHALADSLLIALLVASIALAGTETHGWLCWLFSMWDGMGLSMLVDVEEWWVDMSRRFKGFLPCFRDGSRIGMTCGDCIRSVERLFS